MIDACAGVFDEPEDPDEDPLTEWWDEDRMPWWDWPPEASEEAA